MVPRLDKIKQIEEVSAKNKPSDEGAWWIMLQTAESVCNLAALRDPLNNAFLTEFWSEAAAGVADYLEQEGNRPLPYDDLMQLISFCGTQLREVVKEPRYSLVKVDRMVRPEKLRDVGYKTIQWLGKQPGKTVREKMAGKRLLLTQKKEYSFDIKENQVARMLYEKLMERVSDRMNNGVKKGAYDTTDNSQINQMFQIKKLLRESPLREIAAKNHTRANNALLSDKNYSILWRAYLELSKYGVHLEKRWNQALELYVRAFFLAMNAKLLSYGEVFVSEERTEPNGAKEPEAVYILGGRSRTPYLVKLALSETNISISVCAVPVNGRRNSALVKSIRLSFSAEDATGGRRARRGTPLSVAVEEDGVKKTGNYYADISCIRELTAECAKRIFAFTGMGQKKAEKGKSSVCAASMAFDLVENGRFLGIAGETVSICEGFSSDRAVVYKNDALETVYPCGHNGIHLDADGEIAVCDAVLSEENRGLKAVLDELCKKVSLKQEDYFFYLVPDALEELRQKNLKQCVSGCFSKTFPVWRSVAALSAWLEPSAFSEDDIFVYMDLTGDTATAGMMTIHYEEVLENYTCNHFPPFPQVAEGDRVTEGAFCTEYVRAYAKKYQLEVSEAVAAGLVKNNSVKKLLEEKSHANFFYRDGEKICSCQIAYDAGLVDGLVTEWVKNIGIFWNKVKKRLGPYAANYVYFLSDLFLALVPKEAAWTIFSREEQARLRKIFGSTTQKILEGALLFKERLNRHLPVWTEYLPKLSLKIPIAGKYVDWDLIGADMAIHVMEEDREFPIKEQKPLRLHAGAGEYCFELKKEDISRRPSRMEAVLPMNAGLEKDMDVNLFIRYKYGSENSYELILRPVDAKDAPFEELVAEWRSGYREKRNVGGPKFPALGGGEELERIKRDAGEIRISLQKTGRAMENYLGRRYHHTRVVESFRFEQTCKYLTIHTFRLRETLRYYALNERVRELVQWFFGSWLYEGCKELMLLETYHYLSEDFIEDYKDTPELEELRERATQLIYSFGAYVPEDVRQRLTMVYKWRFKNRQSILINAVYKNTEDGEIWLLLLKMLRKRQLVIANIRNLSNLCWCDEAVIPKLWETPELVERIIGDAVVEFGNLQRVSPDFPKKSLLRKKYLSLVEVILAILRLRENPEFRLLAAGTKEAVELAELIRQVDDMMGNPESRIRLAVEKPEALQKMSNIAYAIDMYLTGSDAAASIEVISVEADGGSDG